MSTPITFRCRIGRRSQRRPPELTFTDPLEPKAVGPKSFDVKVWELSRTKNYGSKHIDEKLQSVVAATVNSDGKTVRLEIPNLAPTWGMEIKYRLISDNGRPISGTIHNTIHELGR